MPGEKGRTMVNFKARSVIMAVEKYLVTRCHGIKSRVGLQETVALIYGQVVRVLADPDHQSSLMQDRRRSRVGNRDATVLVFSARRSEFATDKQIHRSPIAGQRN